MWCFCQMFLMLILGSLTLYSNHVFASQKSYQIGNSEVTANVDDGFERLVNKEYKPHFEKYVTKQSVSAEISYKGVSAAQKTAVGVERSVARSAVLKNLLAKARLGGTALVKGAAVGWEGGPWGVAAATAAFYLIDSALQKEGYEYNKDAGDFGKVDPDYGYCVSELNTGSRCSEYRIERKLDFWQKGSSDNEELQKAMCALAFSKGVRFNPVNFEPTEFKVKGSWCVAAAEKYVEGRKVDFSEMFAILSYVKYKGAFTPISQSKFNEIVGPKADAAPSQYVNATAYDDGTIPDEDESPDVSVEKGTVVQLGPFTDTDGQAKQVTLTFGKDAQGRTTVSVKETPRPDLKPKSSEAPVPEKKPRTEIIPNPNPDKKPDKDSDKDKDKEGKEKPDPDGKPSDKEKPDPNGKPDGGDKPKPDDKPKAGLLCEIFPKILACAEMGDVEENEPFQVPNIKDETTFSPDNFLPSNGICPAPKTVNILGNSYTVSYDLLCRFAEMSRFLILAIAAVLAARIMFGSQKKD